MDMATRWKNHIKQDDRVILIQKLKDLVYVQTEQELGKVYTKKFKDLLKFRDIPVSLHTFKACGLNGRC